MNKIKLLFPRIKLDYQEIGAYANRELPSWIDLIIIDDVIQFIMNPTLSDIGIYKFKIFNKK